ncbi:hypothetical protein LTR35_008151 [Friedmanniomyces endolithicus]|uniref:Uncharacterized protein n=1 Tax=Friedmanniomyces endolithicus TaxID=329885 RepID=A0AAN6FZN9_9PEZI|nr:hypothetical protein LTR35_008151 [Friedmanniomyces endolithicus]KAK0282139.1 hypothetical protein LTS00_012254 [Friedmanniomyces endolithicus]KAK0327474.1 hypothetical protein LTR82_000989 [Friedmanniomyces endolithicus]KAK1017963.1 hypothetical protein LTR54_001809 [Friedmanniomyces endolithicus]KAK1059433.1 hypothetical protein LTR74_012657 [Friedmanniomyces endolithicus]
MANVRDPAFWKRFSTAVHLDEEGGYTSRPELKHSDSWLGKQRRKQQRRRFVCLWFWLCFFLFVAGVVAAVIWVLKSGILNNVRLGDGNGTPNQPADPNSNANSRVRRLVEMVVR